MRLPLSLLLHAVVLLAATNAGATLDARLRGYDLGQRDACRVFVDADAVQARKDKWRAALEDVWEQDPQSVVDWIIGAAAPPSLAAREALLQRDCMIDLLMEDAASPRTDVIVDLQQERASKATMANLYRRYRTSRAVRRRTVDQLTASEHRDARTQSWIWRRKFVFSGRPFNYVSEFAAAKCDLTAHTSWRPESSNHRTCWLHTLTPDEREREILLASAAPGISRHHWGTDVDLFSLNPVRFVTGRHADEYVWMTENALLWGFFQPYTARQFNGPQYMEERWHWSYYPIAQALLELAAQHREEVGAALQRQWDAMQQRWGTRVDAFAFVRVHWAHYMFHVDADLNRRGATP